MKPKSSGNGQFSYTTDRNNGKKTAESRKIFFDARQFSYMTEKGMKKKNKLPDSILYDVTVFFVEFYSKFIAA